MLDKRDIKIECIHSSKKCGGQNTNKVASTVRATHIPTGITVRIEGRDQGQNKKRAIKELEKRIEEQKQEIKAKAKKARRDEVIHDHTTIRTYDFKKGLVKDHRSGKTASLRDVLYKGRIDLLRG
jgi:peptide chain release factor 1